MSNRLGVIGSKDSVSAFCAVGVEVFDCETAEQAKDLIRHLTREDFAVLFIAESLAEQIPEVINKAKQTVYPLIVPIPLSEGGNGFGMQSIKKDVEKAIGIDILFNKED